MEIIDNIYQFPDNRKISMGISLYFDLKKHLTL